MKKPTLSRGISLTGLALVIIGIAVFVVLSFGDKKQDTKQPASEPVAPVQTTEQIAASQKSIEQFNEVSKVASQNDYAKKISVSVAYATDSANDSKMRLDAFRVCIQAAFTAKDTAKKDDCYNQAKVLANTLPIAQEKDAWLKELDALHMTGQGTPAEGDDGSQ